jgi:hypothetical protein
MSKDSLCSVSTMLPEYQFNSETKAIELIKAIKESYDPNRHKIIIQIGKKSFANLKYAN